MAWKRGKIERGIKAKFTCNRLNSPWGSSPSMRPGSASAFSTRAVGQGSGAVLGSLPALPFPNWLPSARRGWKNQIEPGEGGMRPEPPRAPGVSPSQGRMGFMGLQNALHVQLRVFPARLRAAWRSPAPWVLPQVLQARAEHTASSQRSRVVPNSFSSSSSTARVNKGGDSKDSKGTPHSAVQAPCCSG